MSRRRVQGETVRENPAGSWKPLTKGELVTLHKFKVGPGKITIDRILLGRLVLERERLLYSWQSLALIQSLLQRASGNGPQALEEAVNRSLALVNSALNATEQELSIEFEPRT